MSKHTISVVAGAAALAVVAALGAVPRVRADADHRGAEHRTEARTRALLAALEREDLPAVDAMIDPQVALTIPLSFSGAQEPAGVFDGKQQVLGYARGVFSNMGTIDFTDVRISVTDAGKTSFVQANGNFVTADGRPYRNVYVYRFDWNDGRIVRVEEYANPGPSASRSAFPSADRSPCQADVRAGLTQP